MPVTLNFELPQTTILSIWSMLIGHCNISSLIHWLIKIQEMFGWMSAVPRHWKNRLVVPAVALLAVIGSDTLYAYDPHSHPLGVNGNHTHELSIAITCHAPPYYYLNNDDHGDEWELIKSAFDKAGLTAHALFIPLTDANNALNEGWIDAVWVCGGTELAGQEKHYLSKPLLPRRFLAISIADGDITIKDLSDLRDKRVAAHPNVIEVVGAPLQELERNNPSFQSVSNYLLIVMMLFTNQVDVVVSESSVFAHFRQKLPKSVHPEQPVVCNAIIDTKYPRLVFADRMLRDEFNAAWTVVSAGHVPEQSISREDSLQND
jgi:hypothetical protein